MSKMFKTKDFDMIAFVSELNRNGFDIHNIGGTSEDEFTGGEVYRFKSGQYQMIGSTNAILTSTPNVFYKTLLDVEKQFNYQLFR